MASEEKSVRVAHPIYCVICASTRSPRDAGSRRPATASATAELGALAAPSGAASPVPELPFLHLWPDVEQSENSDRSRHIHASSVTTGD